MRVIESTSSQSNCVCNPKLKAFETLNRFNFERLGVNVLRSAAVLVFFQSASLGWAQVATQGLHNYLEVADSIYSGGEPNGDTDFERLRLLGIKTIISVDGASPAIADAKRFGLRYVHIPIGYDRIERPQSLALARVVRELEGPFYFHCHHGRHRGPAAAAIAGMAADAFSAKQAVEFLKRAGTGQEYRGLWQSVREYSPPQQNAEFPELVEVAELSGVEREMARLDRLFSKLSKMHDRGWKSIPTERFDPRRLGLLVTEALRESGRLAGNDLNANRKNKDFLRLMSESIQVAEQLKEQLDEGEFSGASSSFVKLRGACAECHRRYRN